MQLHSSPPFDPTSLYSLLCLSGSIPPPPVVAFTSLLFPSFSLYFTSLPFTPIHSPSIPFIYLSASLHSLNIPLLYPSLPSTSLQSPSLSFPFPSPYFVTLHKSLTHPYTSLPLPLLLFPFTPLLPFTSHHVFITTPLLPFLHCPSFPSFIPFTSLHSHSFPFYVSSPFPFLPFTRASLHFFISIFSIIFSSFSVLFILTFPSRLIAALHLSSVSYHFLYFFPVNSHHLLPSSSSPSVLFNSLNLPSL